MREYQGEGVGQGMQILLPPGMIVDQCIAMSECLDSAAQCTHPQYTPPGSAHPIHMPDQNGHELCYLRTKSTNSDIAMSFSSLACSLKMGVYQKAKVGQLGETHDVTQLLPMSMLSIP